MCLCMPFIRISPLFCGKSFFFLFLFCVNLILHIICLVRDECFVRSWCTEYSSLRLNYCGRALGGNVKRRSLAPCLEQTPPVFKNTFRMCGFTTDSQPCISTQWLPHCHQSIPRWQDRTSVFTVSLNDCRLKIVRS